MLMKLCSRTTVKLNKPSSSASSSQRCRRSVCHVKRADLDGAFAQIANELDAVLEAVKTGKDTTSQATKKEMKMDQDNVLYCDENGCVLLDKKARAQASSSSTRLDRLLTGKGWVLGVSEDPASPLFGAVVGGNTWTVSLTKAELDDFILAVLSIRRTLQDMKTHNAHPPTSGDKPLKVKWTTETVLMEATCETAEPRPDRFQLSFKIGAGRAVRASWQPDLVADMLVKLDQHLGETAQPPREAVAA